MDNKDKIRVLSDREQAREKLPIFFGSRENYLHPFREAVGNAVDEINNNYSKGIVTVTLKDDNRTITVADTGRGIPIYGETDGKPNTELLFETLFAGTNYDNKDNGKITVGTNGVGLTVTNFTSKLFRVVSVRNGNKYTVTYTDGATTKSDLQITEADEKAHGSIFTFELDEEVYTNVVYNPDDIEAIVKRIASTANKIKFKFKYKDTVKEFQYEDLEQYFKESTMNLTSWYCKG